MAIELRKALGLEQRQLIQFWTDPLSLGRCDSVADIPRSRFIHKWNERRLLKAADKVVFWFPLLCQMEQQLHPLYAEKMTWSDVSYVPHVNLSRTNNERQHVSIGLFGAYPANVRNITPLLEAIKRLPNIKFVIRGDGDLPYDVSNISNLDIRQGRRPIDEIEALENDCDILLSLSSKNGIAPGGKTFYYASYNKPIIHIADGVNGESYNGYLKDLGERYVCCMNNVDEIQSTITKVVSELPNFSLKIPQRMDAAVIARKIIEE